MRDRGSSPALARRPTIARRVAIAGLALAAIVAPLLFLRGSDSAADVIQQAGVRVTFNGALRPRSLPRQGSAPVEVSFAAKIGSASAGTPPQLRRIAIAINRFGHIDSGGLPECAMRQIQPATTEAALAVCGDSLVGRGQFKAQVLINQQAPFPASGPVLAFFGRFRGKPAVLAHVYGVEPVPTSFTLPFTISRTSGTYGTVLEAELPAVTGSTGYVTGLSLRLGRSFRVDGRQRSFLAASCPAPKGFPGAVFPLARARLGFDAQSLTTTVAGSCDVRG